ncbi:molybdopterin biosynthesis protein [Haloarcula nitratireducens]|uniref:Molybdopterin biosynthesis protein n=1 Tax=Haloarcula nitratireducens TaxID=2487749 RepID=A0AAW4P6Y3_9EURY|nr:molybdopterin biosynthesis protein [Halomicroarcula nitratireducens]MBX0293360.1 molybdopterin biosynthesis protein [Halomicroarcula nitratireducens]
MTERGNRRELADLETARATIAELGLGSEPADVPLDDAQGRTLAAAVSADIDVPGFDRAAMDGYAVRASDTVGAGEASPVELAVASELHAGEPPETAVDEGDAVEIATGAVMPESADSVVVVERTTRDGDRVEVRDAVTPGENVLPAGADVAVGDFALSAGTRLTPRTIGLLSALGESSVPVRGRPEVAVVSTGDELVPADEPLDHDAGQIHDVNTPAIMAAVAAAGGEAVRFDSVGDDRGALADALSAAAETADLVLTSGSTSAGSTDVLATLVEEREDTELLLHGVDIQPGKPTVVGRVAGTPYVGLPGYPVSALSVFRVLVAPAIRAATGVPAPAMETEAELAARVRHDGGRYRLVPVGLVADGDGQTLAYPVDKGSGATTSLAYADGVVTVAATTNYVPSGERVTVELFDDEARPPALLCVGDRDPVVSSALSAVERVRYLARGTQAGEQWLADGIPDVAVVTGDPSGGETLAAWNREWGLALGPNADLSGLEALVDGETTVVNAAAGTGLRNAFDDALAELDSERGSARPRDAVEGYGVTAHGLDGPARRVESGDADAAPALRPSAASLGLSFLPLGTQRLSVVALSDRREKDGVESLVAALDGIVELPGYERVA